MSTLTLDQRVLKSEHYSHKGVLQEKTKFFGETVGVSNLICLNDWLSKFKASHGIACKIICREETAVNMETVNSFFTEKWPALLKIKFSPLDIFNADETGLYFNACPSHTLSMRLGKCSRGKWSKERIIVMVA